MRGVHDTCTTGDRGISEMIRIDDLHEHLLDLIYVNRTCCHSLAELLPSIDVPFERVRMDIVMFGSDVSVDCIPQRDGIGPLERDRQLV
jgi:hypothetical protein